MLSGPMSLTAGGPSVVTLTAANTYSAGTTIGGGTLQLGAGGSTGSIASTSALLDNGTLAFNLSGNVTQSGVVGGNAITGTGGLLQMGPGTLTLNAGNAYTGGTAISGGTLRLGNAAALGTGGLTVNGGRLDLAGFSLTLASLSGSAGAIANSATGTLATMTVRQATETTFGGAIDDGAGRVALVLAGPGTLILGGTDAYSGGTYVDEGTLAASSASLAARPAFDHRGRGDVGFRPLGGRRELGAGSRCRTVGRLGCGGAGAEYDGVVAGGPRCGAGDRAAKMEIVHAQIESSTELFDQPTRSLRWRPRY